MTLSLEAFHGTDVVSARSIETSNFNESANDDEWLGRGIYFFVEGISDPLIDAIEWAKAQSWDKDTQSRKYDHLAVLRSQIEINESRLIDLTNLGGLKNFNDLKNKFFDRIFKDFTSTQLRNLSGNHHSCALFNYIVATIHAHAVLHNLYIKHTRERKLFLRLNVPNCTVLCVRRAHFQAETVTVHEERIL